MRHQHTLRAIAALAGIQIATGNAIGYSGFKIGIIEQNIGRIAAKLLRHALHRIGRRFGNRNAAPRRASERNHINAGMGRNRRPYRRPVTLHQIEHTLWYARLMHDLGPHDAGKRRNFRRF